MTLAAGIKGFISIHAPAKGATVKYLYLDEYAIISIHAPAKGATSWRSLCHIRPDYFNPRSREGSDN